MNSPCAESFGPAGDASTDRFLVLGASGFVGRHLLALLRSRGHLVLGTRSRSGKRSGSPELTPFDLARDRVVETVGAALFETGAPVQAVVLAAVDNMDWCYRERDTSRRIYVDGVVRAVDDLVAVGARVTFLSTCYVFDGSEGNYDEDHPVLPVNEYARQKLEVERHLAACSPTAWTLRLDKIVGDDPAEETLFTQWGRLVDRGEPIVCIADSVLSPTFVGDVTEAIRLGAVHRLAGMHHVANPEQFRRADLARSFCGVLGRPNHPVVEKPLHEFRFADARAPKSSLNGSRFAALTGIRHAPMREVMERFVRRLRGGK